MVSKLVEYRYSVKLPFKGGFSKNIVWFLTLPET